MNPSKDPLPEKSFPSSDVRSLIERTKPEDYDGHTEFARMTPAERLSWLDQAVLFIAARKNSSAAVSVAEDAANHYKAKGE